jgi:hypothetical protein
MILRYQGHVFRVLLGAAAAHFPKLLIGQVIRARILCFHFQEKPYGVLLALFGPSANTIQYRGDVIFAHAIIVS